MTVSSYHNSMNFAAAAHRPASAQNRQTTLAPLLPSETYEASRGQVIDSPLLTPKAFHGPGTRPSKTLSTLDQKKAEFADKASADGLLVRGSQEYKEFFSEHNLNWERQEGRHLRALIPDKESQSYSVVEGKITGAREGWAEFDLVAEDGTRTPVNSNFLETFALASPSKMTATKFMALTAEAGYAVEYTPEFEAAFGRWFSPEKLEGKAAMILTVDDSTSEMRLSEGTIEAGDYDQFSLLSVDGKRETIKLNQMRLAGVEIPKA